MRTATMQASIYNEFGAPDVLHLEEVERPQPKSDEVLVSVFAHSVNYGDLTARNFPGIPAKEFHMPGLLRFAARLAFGLRHPAQPVLGSEFAGVVESTGAAVTRFAVGDRVYGYLGQTMGASAEYLTISEDKAIAHAPANLSMEEAATIPYGALMAMNLLKKTPLTDGMRVLVIGASGGIGSAAVQLARIAGAHVTGVAGTKRLPYVTALGAERVIDYTREDITGVPVKYDLIIDVLGKSSFKTVSPIMTTDGRYLRVSFKLRELLQSAWTGLFSSRKVIVGLATEQQGDLDQIRELVESGSYTTVVDRCFPLAAAADAHRYMESGSRSGNVVITLDK